MNSRAGCKACSRWIPAFLLMSCALLPAQGGVTWTQQFPVNSPPPRLTPGMVYDEARDRVILYGGLALGAIALQDTWEWDGANWVQRTPASSPSPHAPGRGMTYDAARQRVVLYGGRNMMSGQPLGDTWEWDGTNWTQRFPANSPGPRDNPAMTYDPMRQRIVLYGGQLPNFQFGTDTWEWDGTNWALLDATSGPPAPYPAIAFDRLRQRIVMLYGFDTWEWSGTSWIRLSPANPPPWTRFHSMNSDSVRGRLVVFGGQSIPPGGFSSRTWEWDGTDWIERFPATSPTGRNFFGMAYDSLRRRIVLFGGGWNNVAAANDTWEYGPLSPATYAPFGSGCPGSAGIPPLAAAPFSLPWIDDTFTVEVGNLFLGSPVFLVAGLSNTSWRGRPLPLSLASYGMPGCNALVSVDAVAFALSTGTSASFAIPICNCPTLIGTTFHHQALVLDPGGAPVVSNAATGVVGGR